VDCRKGHVIYREEFYDFWLLKFSMEEITEMANALWG
jgi:hypothetical protein